MIEGKHCFECGYKRNWFTHWMALEVLGKKGKTIFHEFKPVYAKAEVDAALTPAVKKEAEERSLYDKLHDKFGNED